MHSSVPRQRLFLGAVPNTSRYYLQEYITLQKLFQLPSAIIYKNICDHGSEKSDFAYFNMDRHYICQDFKPRYRSV
jgi:hypothetical protein